VTHTSIRNTLLPTLVIAALMALAGTTQAEAGCTGFPSSVTVAPGMGYSTSATVSNLAFSTYYVTIAQAGNLTLLNLGVTPLPGFTQGTAKGFVGTGTSLFIGFFVPPAAPVGRQSTVTTRVINTAGQIVCQNSFTVTSG
jgi:hypothetical protein